MNRQESLGLGATLQTLARDWELDIGASRAHLHGELVALSDLGDGRDTFLTVSIRVLA